MATKITPDPINPDMRVPRLYNHDMHPGEGVWIKPGKAVPRVVPPAAIPAESDPDWTAIVGAPTDTRYVGGVLQQTATASPEAALRWGSVFAANVSARCTLVHLNPSGGNDSFFLSIRLADIDNYIGLRSFNGNIQLYELVAGVESLLAQKAQPADYVKSVELRAFGDDVVVRISGATLMTATTTLLAAGYVGAILRSITTVPLNLAGAYSAAAL
ncbi:MAG: hypothetical protein DRQ40_07750 [Gammaproteobacteria bacterium]|nr:MAG: hypothetical protein DRQ40_07750 [Gammaproteobacteria bacterium]